MMSFELNKFMKDNKPCGSNSRPAQSELQKHKEQIFQLRLEKYSFRQIATYLNEIGVTISDYSVRNFLSEHRSEYEEFTNNGRSS